MAITVPIVSTWDPKGLDKATGDIKKAEGPWAKAGSAAKKAFVPATAALAGTTAAAFKWVKAAEETGTANARVEQVFKSMGDSTGEAAKQAEIYRTQLSRNIAVDKNTIALTQAKLATFSEVSNETARMSGVFDRATSAAHDMAAAGFGEASGNAVQLGKALQDPIKGINAMTKSGITFTAAEQDKIKALVESGNQLEAQNMILKAVEGQVKGVAEATADDSDKMKIAWQEVSSELGTALLPAFNKLTEIVLVLTDFLKEHSDTIIVVVGVIATLSAAIIAVNVAMKAYDAVMKVADATMWLYNTAQKALHSQAVLNLGVWAKEKAALVASKVAMVANKAAAVAMAAASGVIRGATTAWTTIQWALNAALTANPIGLVIAAIAALVAIVVTAYKKSETFRKIVDGAFRAVGKAVKWMGDTASKAFKAIYDWAVKVIRKAGELLDKFNPFKSFKFPSWLGGSSTVNVAMVPGGYSVASPSAASTVRATVPSGNVTINVSGALDPVATAKQIKRLLETYDGLTGRAIGAPLARAW